MEACTFNLSDLGRFIRSHVFAMYDKVRSAVDSIAKTVFSSYFPTFFSQKSDHTMTRTVSANFSQEMRTSYLFSHLSECSEGDQKAISGPLLESSMSSSSAASVKMPTGLINPENNCFLNSVFQVLIIGNPDVRNAFMQADSKICETDSPEQEQMKAIRLAMQDLIRQYEQNEPLDLSSLRPLLGGQWIEGQQDPQELFTTLIGYLDDSAEECSSLFINTRTQRLFEKEPGYECPILLSDSRNSIGSIGIPFVRNQQGQIVPTQSNGMIYLQNLLHAFHFEGGGHFCWLDSIRGEGSTHDLFEQTRTVKQEIVQFEQPMKSFVVPIKRFEYADGESSKIQTSIEVSEKLSLGNEYFVNQESADYELNGFIVHEGVEAASGHYVAYVSSTQNDVKKYFRCDDGCINSVSRADFLEAAKLAYVLDFHLI
jgi:ubiquitin C-terminal hydrolase